MHVQDTGTELMPTDIKYYQLFGGEKVTFEKEEVTEMKKFGKPGTYLLLYYWESGSEPSYLCTCAARNIFLKHSK